LTESNENEEANIEQAETTPETDGTFDTETRWADLGLGEPLLKAIEEMGYAHPTIVQSACIPKLVEGKDLLVRSKTGSGKTAGFALPMLQNIPDGDRTLRAIVLEPTRELAIQVAEEFGKLGANRDVGVTAIYGGVGLGPQTDALRAGVEVVVGTPGRVLDHLRRGNMNLDECKYVCLDEADEMLSMGFLEEVTGILDHVPPKPQMFLFSATVEADLRNLVERYASEPEEMFLSTDTRTVDGMEHILYETTGEYPKPRQLMHILDIEAPESGIIFCQTRQDTAMLGAFLSRQGIDAEHISSDLSQKGRERVMGRIKRGEIRFLVATDIASRGIDISDLSHVLNYSLPEDPASYLHRVGRTARIGKTGTAISLMSGRELGCRKILEGTWGIEFHVKQLPSREEAKAMWTERHVGELKEVMERVAWEGYLDMAKQLKDRKDGDRLIAAALRGFFIWSRMDARHRAAEARGEDPYEQDRADEEARRRSRQGGRGGGGGGRGGRGGGGGRGGRGGGGGRGGRGGGGGGGGRGRSGGRGRGGRGGGRGRSGGGGGGGGLM